MVALDFEVLPDPGVSKNLKSKCYATGGTKAREGCIGVTRVNEAVLMTIYFVERQTVCPVVAFRQRHIVV